MTITFDANVLGYLRIKHFKGPWGSGIKVTQIVIHLFVICHLPTITPSCKNKKWRRAEKWLLIYSFSYNFFSFLDKYLINSYVVLDLLSKFFQVWGSSHVWVVESASCICKISLFAKISTMGLTLPWPGLCQDYFLIELSCPFYLNSVSI